MEAQALRSFDGTGHRTATFAEMGLELPERRQARSRAETIWNTAQNFLGRCSDRTKNFIDEISTGFSRGPMTGSYEQIRELEAKRKYNAAGGLQTVWEEGSEEEELYDGEDSTITRGQEETKRRKLSETWPQREREQAHTAEAGVQAGQQKARNEQWCIFSTMGNMQQQPDEGWRGGRIALGLKVREDQERRLRCSQGGLAGLSEAQVAAGSRAVTEKMSKNGQLQFGDSYLMPEVSPHHLSNVEEMLKPDKQQQSPHHLHHHHHRHHQEGANCWNIGEDELADVYEELQKRVSTQTIAQSTEDYLQQRNNADQRIARPSAGGKDRHSKVPTSKGLRDRRVRLSPRCAIQLFDIQDRLGFDQPSKAVDWLMEKAKASIDDLPHNTDISASTITFSPTAPQKSPPSIESLGLCSNPPPALPISLSRMLDNPSDKLSSGPAICEGLSLRLSSITEPEASVEEMEGSNAFSALKTNTLFSSIQGGGQGSAEGQPAGLLNGLLLRSRMESRAKARERARERTKERNSCPQEAVVSEAIGAPSIAQFSFLQ